MTDEELDAVGGFAFPVPGSESNYPVFGMTLRDWFAGQALAGMLGDAEPDRPFSDFAKDAYDFADAMLADRKGGAS